MKCQMENQMKEAETWLRIRGSDYLMERNLGDSLAGSEILQHEHHKIENECKDKQESCMKLVKSAEDLYRKGNYAGEELQSRTYHLLSECTELTAAMEQRRQLLADSVHFFNKAQTALTKLDQIEIQLTTSETPTLSTTVEEIANSAIQDGRQILSTTGITEPGAQGIVRKVEELESKRKKLSTMCKAKEMAASEKSVAFKKFCEKYDELIKWLSNNGQFFVQRTRDMGTTQTAAKTFVEQHEAMQNDLRMKTMEVEALLRTVPNLVRSGGEEAEVVLGKSENIKQEFLHLRMTLEKRILIAQRYLAFLKLSSKVAKEMDEFESLIKEVIEVPKQEKFRSIEEKQITLRQEILQVNNNGRNFLEDARKMDDMYLNMSQPCATVEDILSRLELRNVTLTTQWLNFQNEISATKETLIQWENLIKESNKAIKSAQDLESKMFPVIPRELNRVDSILPFLENRMVILLPQIKSVQKEMDGFIKKSQALSPLDDSNREGKQAMEKLKAVNQDFQKKLTDYQILVSMMTAFFKNFEELEKLIDMQESQYRMNVLPNDVARMETLIHDHETNKPTVMELFKFSNTEAQTLINKINDAESPEAAASDREKISMIHSSRRSTFERAWEDHKNKLEQHNQMCIFNRDMHLINQQIEGLNNQLTSLRQSYGESLPSALHTSEAFLQFEKTIELLQIRIYEFVSTAERMMRDQRVDSSRVNQEIQTMQKKWSTFRTEVTTNRKLIEVAIEYYKTIEEAEEWLKEGSRLLISVARKSSTCAKESDAENLKEDVQDFLNKGKGEQEERLKKISSLSMQLYGSQAHPPTELISSKNRDMMESFSSISTELTTLTTNIRVTQQTKIVEQKGKEEIDAVLQAAQAEAEAAKAAAAAAQQAAKLAEAAAKAIPPKAPEPPQRPPRFIRQLTNAEINEGTKFTFECEVDGHPMPQVQWFKEGILVENNPDYQTSMENGICKLTIEETFSEDTAKFICRANNPAGVAETQSQLVVKEAHAQNELIPPHFVQEPLDSTVAEGESQQLECQVFGNPLPLVSWFKDDVCIDYSTDYSITYNNGFCTLKIDEAHTDHQGRYTCRAVNPVGQVACSANLLVSSSLPYERPSIVVPLSNVMARAGQKLRLECTISGQPEPQITWLHNSKSLKETRDSKLHFDGRNATLVITEAFPKDAGTYTIIARNKAGEAVSSCNVSVKGRLPMETSDSEIASDIEPAKPQVKQQLDDQTVIEGNRVRMDCVIVGQPEPEVIWYHNGKPVKESDDFQLLFEGDRCTLIIKTAYLEDAGTYKCVAINSGGEASSVCQLKVEPVAEIVHKSEFSQKDILISVEKIEPPKFLKLLEGSSVTEGQEVVLECRVTAEPKATLTWYKDGIQITSTPQYQLQPDDSGLSCLRMPCVQIHDRGTYSVRAQNKGGEAQSFCTLVVSPPVNYVQRQTQVPPSFLRHVENQVLRPKGTAKFETLVDGTPTPQVRWNFQGKPVPKDQHHKVGSDGNKHWLIIQDVSKVHNGRYSAIAENDAGIATTSALLSVEEPPAEPTVDTSCFEQRAQSMVMTKKTVMQTSTLSSMSELSDIEFQPPEFPSFSSLQSQQLVRMEQSVPSPPVVPFVLAPVTVIPPVTKPVAAPVPVTLPVAAPVPVILPVTKQVAAPVRVILPVTKQVAAPVPVPVPVSIVPVSVPVPVSIEPPPPPSVPPKFIRPVSTAIVTEGEKLFLEAQVEGSPEPKIQWSKDDVELKNRPGLTVSTTGCRTSVFIMKSVESDGGRYSCIASNNAGRATSIAEVRVKPYRESPKFKKKLEASLVKSGSRVTLQVEVTGVPVPEVKWYRNGSILQDSPDCRISSSGNTHTLLINEVFPDDSGCYMAAATNVAGEARSIADLVVEEEKSPDEEKLITYQEFSTIQQKKEMYTKISMNQPPSLEPYVLPSEVPKAIEPAPVKVPSPPPMAAIESKVWAQPKPEPFPAPAITEAPEPILIPSPEKSPEKEIKPIEEKPVETVSFQATMPVEQPRYFPSSVPVTSALKESMVKQSIMKFSQPSIQQQTQAEERKMTVASKTSTQPPIIQNGFDTESKTTTESFSSMKQSTFISESKSVVSSGSVSTPKPSQVPVPTKFVPKAVAPPVQKEKEKPTQSLVPVWKPKKDPEPKPSWRKVQVPQQTASTITQSTVENQFSSTELPQVSDSKFSASETKSTTTTSSQTSSMPSFFSTESSTTTRTSYSTEEISITKKYEMVVEHSSEAITSDSGVKPTPKPIIKKEVKEGPKPKKEVVIEEEPVVGAEVKPPHFSKILQDIIANEKDQIVFECHVEATPAPTLRWFKDHNQIAASEDYQISYHKGVSILCIPEAYPEDSGKYTCTATNIGGCKTTSAYLTVNEPENEEDDNMVIQPPATQVQGHRPLNASPPIFEKPPTMGRFIEGGDANFECKVRGNPQPEVVWSRRGMPIQNDNRRQVSYSSSTGMCTFKIKGLTAEDDGEYTCTAVNCAGEASLTVSIQRDVKGVSQDTFRQVSMPMSNVQTQFIDQQRQVSGSFVQSYSQQQHMDGMYQRTTSADYEIDPSCPMYYSGTESFRVDTFEYRLLREIEFRESLFRRLPGEEVPEKPAPLDKAQPPSAPQIIARPRNSKLLEGSEATFQAKIMGNPKPKITWFKNGQRIIASQRFKMSYTDDVATLHIHMALPEDAGYYTLLAENTNGRIACSTHLVIEGVGVPVTTTFHQQLQQQRTDGVSTTATTTSVRTVQENDVDTSSTTGASRALKPNFVKIPGDKEVTEGKMVRFDLRVSGRPFPDVTWYLNGNQVVDDATHKLLVNEGGVHALMITTTSRTDAGTYTCVAKNKSGDATFNVNLHVIEKEQIVAPKFVERFQSIHVREGEPVTLHCRAIGTPVPSITWQRDGVQVHSQPPNILIETIDGASTIYFNQVNILDSAWYQCTAQNQAGSTATRARLYVESESTPVSEPWRLNLPRPQKVIQPEGSPPREVVWLKPVERAAPRARAPEEERPPQKPAFTTHIQNLNLQEGDRAHFDARLVPIGDPTMVIEWYVNGKPVEASSRVMTTYSFGYVALTLLHVYGEDSGVYMCRAVNEAGEATTTATLRCVARAKIERTPQHPESMEAIRHLEDYEKYQRQESVEETASQQMPVFIRPLQSLENLLEGGFAHFEAQITPVSDPTMKVEWLFNGKALTAGTRISTTFSFGYVALNISYVRAEDSGVYMCKATNQKGEAISTATLKVKVTEQVTGSLGIPEQQSYIQKTQELEAYQMQQKQTYVEIDQTVRQKPYFKTQLIEKLELNEGKTAHFEARLEPSGDSTMRIEWLKDGKALEASSRISTFFNFGYVSLTIRGVDSRDTGTYTCIATNSMGSTSSTSKFICISKKSIVVESQHPEGLEKIQHLEDYSKYQRDTREDVTFTQKPTFTAKLTGKTQLIEGQSAHFETRLEPMGDPSMTVEWYFNGRPLTTGHRFRTYFDFGYVALDILYVFPEDTGTFSVVARNSLGEATLSKQIYVQAKSSVDTSTIHEIEEKIEYLERPAHVDTDRFIEELSKSKPYFPIPLHSPKPLREGERVHLECRVEPVGDPTLKIEWFFNGKALPSGSRFQTKHEFGLIVLDIITAYPENTGEYTIRATNHLGSAHTSACITVIGKSGVVSETQHPEGLEKIQHLEDSSRYKRDQFEETVITQLPTFTKPLHNIETIEGTNIHLECRLAPVGDPTMRVEWFVNGAPLKVGHRFRPAFEFDYVALDILSVYAEDSGVYTCKATSSLGQAVTSCTVKCTGRSQIILESQHPEGLQQIQYLEDQSRHQRDTWVEEAVKIQPRFVTKLNNLTLNEGQLAHFECRLEPINDSSLRVEWFRNGKSLPVGHRYKPYHDFGYVALNILSVVPEDTATYTCRAVNTIGTAEIQATLTVSGKSSIISETQHPEGLQKIQMLEDYSRYTRDVYQEELTSQSPVFTKAPQNIEIKEGQRVHFECRLIPVGDPKLKVEWFHNGKPVKQGTRFIQTFNFGYVALDIMYAYPEDSGTYTCKAVNALGEAVTSATLKCYGKSGLILESQQPESLEKIQQLEDMSRYQRTTYIDESTTQAPVFTQAMKNLQLLENKSAHFECRLIPVGDNKLKVEWFHNGVAIMPASRVTLTHDFGFVALDLAYVKPEDSGTYTCKATNELGQAVCSATLNVRGSSSLLLETQHPEGLQKIQYLEDASRHHREVSEDVRVTSAPIFITPLSGPKKLVEGNSSHLECRIEPYPDPTMKIEWFYNGKPLPSGSRYRTMFDFGFAALDILTVNAEDSGEYTIRATNCLGTATSTAIITVSAKKSLILESQQPDSLQKIRMLEDQSRFARPEEPEQMFEKPNFGRPLYNLDNLIEGQSAHLEATLTPVNDPSMKVEWFHNGVPIKQAHRFRTICDFGYVAMDILHVVAEDCGTYMCKATNRVGEAVTTCSIKVQAKGSIYTDTLHEEGLQKIRALEEHYRPVPEEPVIPVTRPVFITPLKNVENVEGQPIHLECKLEPVNDPKLKVEWYVNGIEIKAGHRFRTIHDFGYVALDILYSYAEDSGTYMCKAVNELGEAVTTCTVKIEARRSIYYDTQHPDGLEKIRELECQSKFRPVEVEEKPVCKPYFVSELRGVTEYTEGDSAHFEARVEPAHDSELKIEFFHNGKPLDAASRFHVTLDFGYVALDISHMYPKDAGQYTCRAFNKLGEATSSINILVHSRSGVISDTQHPEGLAKIQALEGEPKYRAPDYAETKTFQRPVFTVPLQNVELMEGQSAHLECRLIPVGDPTLKVEWFFNEKPLQPSSRFQTTHDFGYVALDIQYVRPDDNGIYMCRASNELGEAITTCSIKVQTKAFIELQSHHPEGYEKIQELENYKAAPMEEQPEKSFEKPVFTLPLYGPAEVMEGMPAHFEARVVPIGDPDLKIQWFVNGVALKQAARFREIHDFGMVSLDIASTISEDSGVYMCKAFNKAGEAVTSTSTVVRALGSIFGESQHPEAYEQTQKFEFGPSPVGEPEVAPPRAPFFTEHLINHDKLVEGQYVHLEARVEPANDEKLRVEWYKNGKTLVFGTRIRTTFDFGLVSLDIVTVRPDDSGIYTCRAVNEVGEAITTCTMKVEDRENIIYRSQHPDSLPKIMELESIQLVSPEQKEVAYEKPIFITHLNNLELKEGAPAHFECRVEPYRDPKLKIEFQLNGKPLPAATRFTASKDFGYITLDISHILLEDAGIYTCKASNERGEAMTTGSLKVIGDNEYVIERTTHPMGQEGLSKVREVEELYMSKYITSIEDKELQYPKPYFIVPLQEKYSVNESEGLRLDCRVEPAADPKLCIEWFFNGKPLSLGTRFQLTNDFGQVVLAATDMWGRDSGVYTCRAYNAMGEAFTSTTIHCAAKGTIYEGTLHPEGEKGLESIQTLEESLLRPTDQAITDEKGHPPVFTSHFQNLTNLTEGDIAHFEATLAPAGDQTMVVEWFFQGQPIKAGHRIRTVHAFGMVVLEILGVVMEDSGEYTCRATNKWGRAEITVKLECIDRERGQKPKFTTQLQSLIGLKEGDSAHFECHLIPVGDPAMRIEWFHNGVPMRHSSRIKTLSDFGYVVMDISFVHVEDSGEYVCTATNKFGSDTTRCTIQCTGHGKIFRDTLQPQSLEKIAELEGSHALYRTQISMDSKITEAPKFTTQIKEITNLVEGQSAHFEAYLTPTNDPNLKVEWFFKGKLLGAGHRFRTFHDFGIVILDILYCYGEDTGEYMCKATNKFGSDITKTTITCKSKSSIILDPQIPKEMADSNRRIMELEEHLYRSRSEYTEEVHLEAPRFTVPLENIPDLREGENAHLEARLTPTDDPDLKVEWFKNGKTLKAGTRIRTINDFGFVVLEISPVYPEDSGLYSCKAINKVGEAVTTCTIKCSGKRSIIMDTQLPYGMESIERIARFEDISSARIPEQWMDVDVQQPPKFITKPQDITLPENSLAHFECRLTPVNDPTMNVEWYHNGKTLITGSRVKTINDFGFVILEVAGVFSRDAGVYMCKATNAYGEASVTAKLTVKAKGSIILEPQLPTEWRSGTESLQKLEEAMYRTEEVIIDDDRKLPPKFITQIQNLDNKVEGEASHFECRLEPVGDPTMRVEWFLNGKPLTTGTRVHTVDDFGFVVLDIDWLFPRDAGEYMCRATNKWGQDTTKAILKIKSKRDIIMDSQLPKGMSADKLRELDFPPQQAPPLEEAPPQPPKFITQIQPQENLQEGDSAHFECRLEPVNDPKLRVEWYHNGKPLKSGHRFKTTHDFGFVALDVLYVYTEDSGEYTARAVNDYGEDTTRTTLKIKAQRLLEYRTQLPKSMESGVQKIAEMEASWQRVVTEEDMPPEKCRPTFVMKPEPQVVTEGEWAKFCCRVIGNPRPRIMWILNGKTIGPGSRYKLTYDGIYHLDIPKSRQYDQGKVEVFARNGLGEAYCFTTLEVRPRHDDYRLVLKNSPRPWYDSEVKSYQKVRAETELEQVFEEKLTPGGTRIDVWKTKEDDEGEHVKHIKRLGEEDTKKMIPDVKRYKTESIYIDPVTGEKRIEEQSQVQYMAKTYESQAQIDNQKVVVPLLPSSPQESSIYGKEVHVSKQKQTQKEVKGDLEITRHKTVTETREQEHKAVTKERKVIGVVPETKPPMFTKKIEPCRAFEGASGTFTCTFTGYPEPHITWFRENFPIKDSQDFQITTTDTSSTLVVREVYLEDSGVFSVKAENRGGTAKSSANLVVEERKEQVRGAIPPSFVKTIQDASAKVGQLVRLDAIIAGSKPLDVYWLKNGKKIIQDITHKTVEEEDQYTLLILEAAPEDVGSYECVAINKVGEGRCQASIQVQAAPAPKAKSTPKKTEKKNKAPECIEPLKDSTVKESQPATFRCRFSGAPAPEVKWYRGEIMVKQSRYFRMSVENDVYTLRISEAFPEDEGTYKCVASNSAGTASTSANLKVVVPEVTEIPPSVSPLADLTVPEGSPARFVTTVTGTPTPKITWYREGTIVKASRDFQMFQDGGSCSLVIRQTYPEDEGVYTCRATNASGQAETSARLTVESKR